MTTKTKAPRKPKAKAAAAPMTREEQVKAYLGAISSGRAAFRRADDLLEQLSREVGPDEVIEIGRGGKWRIRDKFAKANSAFKSVSISRYELERVS